MNSGRAKIISSMLIWGALEYLPAFQISMAFLGSPIIVSQKEMSFSN
ncbi:MAG: hypothetical protein J7K57_00175 [Palaeococcus sp.]|nr:hypothetical protein [Palaeococcus sp. (in: euryarchaeotes)]MCD6558291.1 hypothetical protein [Palaeococcus sp. (in: euryarchaeotes)]